jgi:hypothetical protein
MKGCTCFSGLRGNEKNQREVEGRESRQDQRERLRAESLDISCYGDVSEEASDALWQWV